MTKAKDTVACMVKRDYWLSEEQRVALKLDHVRVRAGTVVDVDKDTAMDGIEGGTLERVKA
tara:strand:- start:1222 stop:1404 length:183 start_codon:yes stop_codon:yes gene_type:complete